MLALILENHLQVGIGIHPLNRSSVPIDLYRHTEAGELYATHPNHIFDKPLAGAISAFFCHVKPHRGEAPITHLQVEMLTRPMELPSIHRIGA